MPTLHHLALGARDVDGVAGFYRDVLGLPEHGRHLASDGSLRSVWLRLGSSILMIERTDETRSHVDGIGAGLFLIAIGVAPEERALVEARLEAAGAPIESRTEFTSYSRDPEGHRIAISHWPEPRVGLASCAGEG